MEKFPPLHLHPSGASLNITSDLQQLHFDRTGFTQTPETQGFVLFNHYTTVLNIRQVVLRTSIPIRKESLSTTEQIGLI